MKKLLRTLGILVVFAGGFLFALKNTTRFDFSAVTETGVDLTSCVSYFDGCNTCTVVSGQVTACTKMYCETPAEPQCLLYEWTGMDLSGCVSYFDGCNTCSVKDGRLDACTEMYCETPSESKCLQYTVIGIMDKFMTGDDVAGFVSDDDSNIGIITLYYSYLQDHQFQQAHDMITGTTSSVSRLNVLYGKVTRIMIYDFTSLDEGLYRGMVAIEEVTGAALRKYTYQTTKQIIDGKIKHVSSVILSDITRSASADIGIQTGGISYGGIGVVLSATMFSNLLHGNDYFPLIDRVLDNSPASRAGLQASDFITMIDNVSVKNMNPVDVAAKLKGLVGDTVVLTIERQQANGEWLFLEKEIVRQSIEVSYSIYAYGQGYVDPNSLDFAFGFMGYVRIDDAIYYRGSGDPDKKLDGVDIASFEILLEGDGKDHGFAKDKNNLYLYGNKRSIPGLDLSTVQIIDHNYIKDQNNVYDFLYNKRIEGADVATFRVLDSGMARDKDHMIAGGLVLSGLDANTFEMIGDGSYARDKNHVYQLTVEGDERWSIIEGADPKTFVLPY